jgi:hypothetical protein
MSENASKPSRVLLALIGRRWAEGMIVAALVVVASAESLSSDDKVPQAPHSGESFAKPWHIRLPRPVMLEAWERLRNVEIPGVPLDPRFRINGTEYYVSPEGNDAADGSKDHPWKTLQFAVAHLKSGTVVNLMGGTYYGPVEIAAKATEQSPAALRGAPGQEVVVTYPDSYIQQQQGRNDEVLHTIREVSRLCPVSLKIFVVQPGVSKASVTRDQLQLQAVTKNYLMETFRLGFGVITSQ